MMMSKTTVGDNRFSLSYKIAKLSYNFLLMVDINSTALKPT